MPPKRNTKVPKAYGRQASGKTIKSLSMDADLVQWAESQALEAGLSLSAWLNGTLRSRMPSPRPPKSGKPPAKTTNKAAPKAAKKAKPKKKA